MNKEKIELYSEYINELKEKNKTEALDILDEVSALKKVPEIRISKSGSDLYHKIENMEDEEEKKALINIFFNELNNLSWYGIFTIQIRISKEADDIAILDFVESHDIENDWSNELADELESKLENCSNKSIKIKFERKLKGIRRKVERNISDNFGTILKELRLKRGLSLKELESLSGVSASYINRLEKSERKAPSIPIAKDIANVFGEDGQTLLNSIHIEDSEPKNFSDLIYKSNFTLSNFKANSENKEFIVSLINKIFSDNKNLTKEQMNNILNNIRL